MSDLTELRRKILKMEDQIFFKNSEIFYKDIPGLFEQWSLFEKYSQ